ncbi:DNA polymerase III subunit gamma/tau [Litorivicinus sp.]|nr:DNA polymerase III subunit gamma/tau [Litorivicinus sp.]
MSQQVLARKWRPTTFEQLIGQEHVRKALMHGLDSGRLHHAYLFTGTRGVGKTTIARILARCLNCEQGISATPCGECSNCRAISENRFIDLLEVDAASRTKVDDTRELLENVSYAPSQGRYKVYLIDEVHMLTTHSFNALLKTLEEPPEHVVFLLATTDPQKLLPTVLSRCLQFHLRDLSPDLVESHLEHVLTEEKVTYENDALWHLAKAGRGSVRDAMTLLDQAIAHGQGTVTSANVIEMLGTQGVSAIPLLLTDIAKGKAVEALQRIEQLSRETPDWMALVSCIQSMLHQVAVAQINNAGIDHLSPSEQKAVRELATQMSPEFLQLAYQFALTGYRDLPMASDARSAFEMLIIRMIAFRPARAGEYLSETGSDSESQPEPQPEPAPDVSAPTDGLDMELIPPAQTSNDLSETEDHKTTDPVVKEAVIDLGSESSYQMQDETTDPAITVDTHMLADATRTSKEEAEDTEHEVEDQPLRLSLSPDAWVYESHLLGLNGMTASLLAQTVLISASANEIILATTPHTHSLINDMHQQRITEAFASQLGHPAVLVITVRDDLAETPEQYRLRLSQERLAVAKKQFTEDPFVSALTERFDATVRTESIEPRDGGTHV